MASWAAFATTTRPSALEEAACSDSHCDGDAFVAVVISFRIDMIFDSICFSFRAIFVISSFIIA